MLAETHSEVMVYKWSSWVEIPAPFMSNDPNATVPDDPTGNTQFSQQNVPTDLGPTTVVKPLHTGVWNYTFVDGHVKSLRPEATIGKGVNGNGKDINGNPCTRTYPCGQWTIDEND